MRSWFCGHALPYSPLPHSHRRHFQQLRVPAGDHFHSGFEPFAHLDPLLLAQTQFNFDPSRHGSIDNVDLGYSGKCSPGVRRYCQDQYICTDEDVGLTEAADTQSPPTVGNLDSQPISARHSHPSSKLDKEDYCFVSARLARSCVDRESHTRTVKSPEPETSRVPSGLQATAWT
jgi:hypothetical protein